MKEILDVINRPNGVDVLWQKGNESKVECFTFEELVDMKVNASDVVNNPKDYELDLDKHMLVVKKLSVLHPK